MTQVLMASDECGIAEAVSSLRAGQCVAFPTDTVYGLGCDLWSPSAIEHLYWVKQRPGHLAIPVLVASPDDVAKVSEDAAPAFSRLVARFWPGGLTVVVRRKPAVPDVLCAGKATVAVRMPDHPLAIRLIREMGGVLAVTSANLSGHPSCTTAEKVLAGLGGRIAVLLDGGTCAGGIASTIVSLVTQPPRVLRTGAVSCKELCTVLPQLTCSTD